MLLVRLTLAAIVSLLPIVLEGSYGLPLTGDEAETFLHDARIVGMKPIGVGITKPMKVTLSDGERTHHAVFKSIDEVRHGVVRGRNGGFQTAFKDSYKYEIAAYELDKILGLELVPPTARSTVRGARCSFGSKALSPSSIDEKKISKRTTTSLGATSNTSYVCSSSSLTTTTRITSGTSSTILASASIASTTREASATSIHWLTRAACADSLALPSRA